MTAPRTAPRARGRMDGFTVLELLIVMSMLGIFLVFLMQMLTDSLRLWQRGEERAAIDARLGVAVRILGEDFERLRALADRQWAPGREARFGRLQRAGGLPPQSGRLYAHEVAFAGTRPATPDLALERPKAADWYPEVRMVVNLEAGETDALQRARLRREIVAEEGQLAPAELEDRVRARLPEIPLRAAGEVALRVLPTGEENGCYLALYRDVRLLDGGVKQRWVDLAELPRAGAPLLSNVLYVEFLFRSQQTESWELPPATPGGPETCWDSARAGTFSAEHPVLAFSGDLDAQSRLDPLDDVMPSWVQIRVTVDEGPDLAYVALLARDVDAQSTQIDVEYVERLPQPDEQPFLKIGGEWIRYGSVSGSRLIGVKRGQRDTKARQHRAGARIHAGRESVLAVPVPVAREYWNAR